MGEAYKVFVKRRGEAAFSEKIFLKMKLKREGVHAVDTMDVTFPPSVNIGVGDEIRAAIGGVPSIATAQSSGSYDGDPNILNREVTYDPDIRGSHNWGINYAGFNPRVRSYTDQSGTKNDVYMYSQVAQHPPANYRYRSGARWYRPVYQLRLEPNLEAVGAQRPTNLGQTVNVDLSGTLDITIRATANITTSGSFGNATPQRDLIFGISEPPSVVDGDHAVINNCKFMVTAEMSNTHVAPTTLNYTWSFYMYAIGRKILIHSYTDTVKAPLSVSHDIRMEVRLGEPDKWYISIDGVLRLAQYMAWIRQPDGNIVTSGEQNLRLDRIIPDHMDFSGLVAFMYGYNVSMYSKEVYPINFVQYNAALGNDSARITQYYPIHLGYHVATPTDYASAVTTYNDPNNRARYKYGGVVRDVSKPTAVRAVKTKSYGKIMGEQEIHGERFYDWQAESIVYDLIRRYTDLDLEPREHYAPDRRIERYVADGNLYDIIRDISTLIDFEFYVDPFKVFYFKPRSAGASTRAYEHGRNCIVNRVGRDDTGLVNDVEVVGRRITERTEIPIIDPAAYPVPGNAQEITVTSRRFTGPTAGRVADWYIVGNNVVYAGGIPAAIEYTTSVDEVARQVRQSSIDKYGRHAKKIILSWVSKEDLEAYASAYIELHSVPQLSLEIKTKIPDPTLEERAIARVINSVKGINGQYEIKDVEWDYPSGDITMHAGEYRFDEYDVHDQIVSKIHRIESNLERSARPTIHVAVDMVLKLGTNVSTGAPPVRPPPANKYGLGVYGVSEYD